MARVVFKVFKHEYFDSPLKELQFAFYSRKKKKLHWFMRYRHVKITHGFWATCACSYVEVDDMQISMICATRSTKNGFMAPITIEAQ
jgi:hypothetical protein